MEATRNCSVCDGIAHNARNTKTAKTSFYKFPDANEEQNTKDMVDINMTTAEMLLRESKMFSSDMRFFLCESYGCI